MLNDLLCFFGWHKWSPRDSIGAVYCERCNKLSIEKTKIRRHEFTTGKILINGKPIVYVREKQDFEP